MSNFDFGHTNKLTLLMGPMKSEKTTAAIRLARKYGKYYKVIFVNPIVDIRTSDGISKSRNGIEINCINVRYLKELVSDQRFIDCQICVIDEAQFFENLNEFVKEWLHIKNFIISALDADYRQNKFGQVWDLIPVASKVKKLVSLCELCANGNRAVATIINPKYENNDSDQVHIVTSDSDYFLPVCFSHIKPKHSN